MNNSADSNVNVKSEKHWKHQACFKHIWWTGRVVQRQLNCLGIVAQKQLHNWKLVKQTTAEQIINTHEPHEKFCEKIWPSGRKQEIKILFYSGWKTTDIRSAMLETFKLKEKVSHLSRLIIGEVVVTQPDPQWCSLKLCSHQSVKLQSRTETCSLLTLKLHLRTHTEQMLQLSFYYRFEYKKHQFSLMLFINHRFLFLQTTIK